MHKDLTKLLVPRSVSFYFFLSIFPSTFTLSTSGLDHGPIARVFPSLLGTNCNRYGMKTTPCLTQPLCLNGI